MAIHSITLPKKQGSRWFFAAGSLAEREFRFQSESANENHEIAVDFQAVEPVEVDPGEGSPLLYSSVSVKTPRTGRPRTRHWFQQREIEGQKVTRIIADKVVTAMLDGARHAGVIAAPLNCFVTLRPANIEDVAPEKRFEFWQDELNRIQGFLRHHEISPVYIWSRESRPDDGWGEHLHLLAHVPKPLRPALIARLQERYSGPNEVDVRPASEIARRAENGKLISAPAYVCKALSQRARLKSNQIYRKGGPIVGKRAGLTRNIDHKAVAAHHSRMQSYRAAA